MNSWLRKRVLVFTGTLCMYGTLMAGLGREINGLLFEWKFKPGEPPYQIVAIFKAVAC